ncbi:hypothetical protein B4107_0747 [Bacillus safensis]|nr:hypothetical protein B4107_0747 [Bacillus safensis]
MWRTSNESVINLKQKQMGDWWFYIVGHHKGQFEEAVIL